VATFYWGDGGVFANGTGNWNTLSNWYMTLAVPPGTCCCGVHGVPAVRLPIDSDTVVLAGFGTGVQNIVVGPASFAGSVSWLTNGSKGVFIAAGVWSGPVTVHQGTPPSGTNYGILGGTFTGTVSLQGGTGSTSFAVIGGGLFLGTVTRTVSDQAAHSRPANSIYGGTYSPSAYFPLQPLTSPPPTAAFLGASPAVAYQIPVASVARIPADPGFAAGGATFAPILVITGIPGGGAHHADEPRARRAARDEGSKHKQELLRTLFEHGHINSKQYQRRK
jgi:hypothetical protein